MNIEYWKSNKKMFHLGLLVFWEQEIACEYMYCEEIDKSVCKHFRSWPRPSQIRLISLNQTFLPEKKTFFYQIKNSGGKTQKCSEFFMVQKLKSIKKRTILYHMILWWFSLWEYILISIGMVVCGLDLWHFEEEKRRSCSLNKSCIGE